MATLSMFEKIRDVHQNLSWKLGFAYGKEGRSHKCPWWADSTVFALAYMQGKGIEIPTPTRRLNTPPPQS